MLRIGAITTHPIQYQAPLWRELASRPNVDLTVYFASRFGMDSAVDKEFGRPISWDIPLLDGYKSQFLKSVKVPLLGDSVAQPLPLSLIGELRRQRLDGLLVHGYVSGAALAGLISGELSRTKIVLRGESHNQGRVPTFASRAKEAVLPRVLKRVHGVVAIGSWNQAYWRDLGVPEEKIQLGYYCIDNDRMRSTVAERADEVAQLRERWASRGAGRFALFTGKMIQKKRADVFLRACAELEHDVVPVVAGSGQLEPELRALAEKSGLNVEWAGFVNQSDIPLYYAAADVFVIPSDFEPWGLALNEAMACGTPVIASTAVASAADLVADKATGAIFPQGDVSALAEAMNRAFSGELEEWKNNVGPVVDSASIPRHADAIVRAFERTA